MDALTRHNDQRIDELEVAMLEAAMDINSDVQFIDCPLNHYFTPHLYVRQILMPKGATITSRVHITCHPFRVMQGVVLIKIDNGEWERIVAPYGGITKAGTRRVLYIEEDTVFETFHPLGFITGDEGELEYEEMLKVVDKIESLITEPYENKLLGGVLKKNIVNQTNIEIQ